GQHNLLNATAAVAVARLAGIPGAATVEAIAGFDGVHRRFEHRGDARGAEFFDDYGQTPTEMEVTVETARRREPMRLIALVQPQRYRRVRSPRRELGACVAGAEAGAARTAHDVPGGRSGGPVPGART